MNQGEIRSVLITGANAGIGKEVARQMALRSEVEHIGLACRDEARARAAQAELEKKTGRSIFEIVLMDVAELSSVRAAVRGLAGPVDALVMNAGGAGGRSANRLTRDGVTEIFAANVLGHAALLDGLIASGKLTRAAVYVGSEAARGVPLMGIKRPALPTSSVEDFIDVITGRNFAGRKFDPLLAYGEAKYIAALWMAQQARLHPGLRLVTMSPGSTHGTEITSSMAAPSPVRMAMKYFVMPVLAPLLGMAHPVKTGAQRIVAALEDPLLQSGVFYASRPKSLTGPVMDQSELFADLADPVIQEHADEAIHRFL